VRVEYGIVAMNTLEGSKRGWKSDGDDGPTCTTSKKRDGGNGKQKLVHDAYTVGWVCVLTCELNAARALLDEEHEPLPPTEKDDNSYVLGRMAGHNVVIAFTGSGAYGTNAAAQTVMHLVQSFRNIRFGLMVGVGGGAPKRPDRNDPLKDVRLGDVVVGTSKGGHGNHP
jgi:hypothetical protein